MPPLPLALTMGEPAGVGGEIALMAWRDRSSEGIAPFYVVDSPERLATLARRLGLDVPMRSIAGPEEAADAFATALPVLPLALPRQVVPGVPDEANAEAVLGAIRLAVEHVRSGRAAAVVTNPIQKAVLYRAGFRHPGQTEFIGELAGGTPVMLLASPELRVVPVTIHLPLRAAIERLTTDLIFTTGRIAAEALRVDFGIARPRLALAGLNPHAGEGGALGREDGEIVAPAVAALRREGVEARGPLSADTLFHPEARRTYDVALGMYHDQVLIPIKTVDFWGGVNVTIGTPVIRTSPDHGTALELAGTAKANPASLIAALKLAATMAANRARHAGG
ncbi:4-hydroxythreonine-4-phosphate dehydrogenase PdxA [Desertibaculum subflavum]|uniref:4-hydroxythreonine-4-phosphate dehydrogenase PdxA n=1 Tax=Desertibaculum subflavum TaxID=2268458 RepID=UPI000E663709